MSLCVVVIVAAVQAVTPRAHALANPWPHTATGGFATPDGGGFWLTYADGGVAPAGAARFYGDAAALPLNGPVVNGVSTVAGDGYWLVASDGGIFRFGGAGFFGSTGSRHLNQPVFAMTPTRTDRGYWLVARDGGIFTFGDARFYGSTGGKTLNQPITGITASPTGHGYRLIAKDGGVFTFGDAPFYGAVPGLGVQVNDVVGMAPTPTNRGYWVARANGAVYAFGDATRFPSYSAPLCDPVTGIVANPAAQGYRLTTRSGATVPFGNAPGGTRITGVQQWCVSQRVCAPSLRTAADYQSLFNTRGPTWDGADGANAVDLGDGRRLWLFGDTFSGPTDATSVLPGYTFLRNSIAIESGNCLEYRLGGLPGMLADYLPPPGYKQWYWPMDGLVDRTNGLVYVSAMRIGVAPGPPGFNWTILENDFVVLDLQSLAVLRTVPIPAHGGLRWGTSILQSNGYIYMYALGSGVPSRQYVARTTLAHLVDGAWEYWDGSSWTTDASAVAPMTFNTFAGTTDNVSLLPAITVEPYGSGYLASAKRCDLYCNDVTAWFSTTPTGPWRGVNDNLGQIADTTMPDDARAYGGHIVPTAYGLLVVWSGNGTNVPWHKYKYGPRVVAPTNLPSDTVLAGP